MKATEELKKDLGKKISGDTKRLEYINQNNKSTSVKEKKNVKLDSAKAVSLYKPKKSILDIFKK